MSYTNQTLIEAFLGRSLSSKETTLLDYVIEAAESFINDKIHTPFGDSAITTKYYDGGSKILEIDPCTAITKVAIVDSDGTVLYEYDEDEYEARPRNDTLKTWIEKRFDGFRHGIANIAVTANFTRGEVPKDIQWLATYLSGRLLSKDVKEGLKAESIEGYSRQFSDFTSEDTKAQMILNKYIEDEVLI